MTARQLLASAVMRSSVVALAVALVLPACGGSVAPGGSSGSSGSSSCTPGAYVFCRCQDRSEGTKLCQDDGKAFSACQCDGRPEQCPVPPPEANPRGCPPVYARSYRGQPCGDVALECAYLAAGDIGADGCFGNDILSCRIAPGGSRVWYAGP